MPRRGRNQQEGREEPAERNQQEPIRPITHVRPKTKECQQEVGEYILYFDRCIKANGWDDALAGQIFPAMFDAADKTLESLTEEVLEGGYQAIKAALMKGQEPLRESKLNKLMNISLGNGENVSTFRSRVVALLSSVYSNFSSEVQQQLSRDHFVHGLPQEIKKTSNDQWRTES